MSKSTSHTAGPWVATVKYPGSPVVVVRRSDGVPVAKAHESAYASQSAILVAEADARLIAAAPDLLAACRTSLYALESQKAADDGYTVHSNAIAALEAAIAKAEGAT